MKKQTKIAAVLSAAAFMMMVSGLPVYAASYGWVTEGDAKVYYDEDGYLTPMPGESAEKTGSISVKMDRS